jgi:putative oxidoreductase
MDVLARIEKLLAMERTALEWAQAPFLLLVRLYWGWGFATNGWGKLHRIDEIARWFGEDLHIPAPLANAYAASLTELIGGILLLVGLGGRIATIPLVVTMCVAYLTSDFGGVQGLFLSAEACEAAKDCIPFEDAAPFSYLMASLIVLLFGAGPLSLDGLVAWWWRKRTAEASKAG